MADSAPPAPPGLPPLSATGPPLPFPGGGDIPWYVRVAIWILIWFGFPVAVTTLLLAVFVGYVPSPLLTNVELSKALLRDLQDHRRDTLDLQGALMRQTRLLRVICQNTSKDRTEWWACHRED